MTPPRCLDCRFCVPPPNPTATIAAPYTYAKCALAPKVDLLTGAADLFYCSTQRTGYQETDCGPHGQFFEPAKVAA